MKAPNMDWYLEGSFFGSLKITKGFIENDLNLQSRRRKQCTVIRKKKL